MGKEFFLTQDVRAGMFAPCKMTLQEYKVFISWCEGLVAEITCGTVETNILFTATNGEAVTAKIDQLKETSDLVPSRIHCPGVIMAASGTSEGVHMSIVLTLFKRPVPGLMLAPRSDILIEGANVSVLGLLKRIKNRAAHHRTWYSYLRWPLSGLLALIWLAFALIYK